MYTHYSDGLSVSGAVQVLYLARALFRWVTCILVSLDMCIIPMDYLYLGLYSYMRDPVELSVFLVMYIQLSPVQY
jgi:hypothetical protein